MPGDNLVTALPAVVHPVGGHGLTNAGADFYKNEVASMPMKTSSQK